TISRAENFGALFDLAHAQNRDLRLVDDRRAEQSSEDARVSNGESTAGNFIRFQLLGSRAIGEIVRRPRQAGDGTIVGPLDYRHNQAPIERDGHAEIDVAFID